MRRPLSFWSAAELLDPEPVPPLVIEQPRRQSALRGRVIRRREPRPCADSPGRDRADAVEGLDHQVGALSAVPNSWRFALPYLPPIPSPFLYNGQIVEWHDGDSCRVYVDRGMREYAVWPIRLLGCNARELSEPGGHEARDEVMRRLPPGSGVVLATVKPDKYGERKDASVFYVGEGQAHDLVAELIADGWVAPWDGRGVQPLPEWPRPAAGGAA